MAPTYEYRQKKPRDVKEGQRILIEYVDDDLRLQMEAAKVESVKAVNPSRYLIQYRRISKKVSERMHVSSRSHLKVLT